MTLEAWVYIPAPLPATGFHGIINHGDSGNSNWYQLSYEATGGDQAPNRFHFRWTNGGSRRTDFTAPVSPDTWYYVVGVLDASTTTAYTYLNGSLDTTVPGADLPTASASTLDIGRALSTEVFKGTIDEVRISRIARSAAWIGASFRNQNTPDTYTSSGSEQTPPSLWIRGRVFEDKNYGGGAGRSLSASSGIGRPGAVVELYNASGTFWTPAPPTPRGITRGHLLGGELHRPGGQLHGALLPDRVQRHGTGGADVSDGRLLRHGLPGHEQGRRGTAPEGRRAGQQRLPDAGGVAGPARADHPVDRPRRRFPDNVVGVDFGFNFDTIVNTNNSGQGSLRQFIRMRTS